MGTWLIILLWTLDMLKTVLQSAGKEYPLYVARYRPILCLIYIQHNMLTFNLKNVNLTSLKVTLSLVLLVELVFLISNCSVRFLNL